MLKDVITYLNNRIEVLGYFNEVLCLVDKIERGGKTYPAQYNANNEYKEINLDNFASLCYWRKNGDVNFSQQVSETSIGTQYTTTIPLKFVGFIKKEDATNDQYFSDNICLAIISNLTVNNSALKSMLKAKKASVTSAKYVTDPKAVSSDEYDNVVFDARYSHAYFSIDFELTFTTNNQCYADICEQLPFSWGYVTVTDNGAEKQIQCGTSYTCAGGGGGVCDDVTVRNSDSTFSTTVASGGTLVTDDTIVNVYVNSLFNQTATYPSLVDQTINIS